MTWLIVFIGGGLGSLARYALSQALPARVDALPLATLLANVLSCVVMGSFLLWFAGRTGPEWRLFVLTGFCGGFSTFSTFSLETVQLFRVGSPVLGVANVAVNLALCVVVLVVLARQHPS